MTVATLKTVIPGSDPGYEQCEILRKVTDRVTLVRPLGSNAEFPVYNWRLSKIHTERF